MADLWITQLQSGANLTYSGGYNGSTNYNMNLNGCDHSRFEERGQPQWHSDQQSVHIGDQRSST